MKARKCLPCSAVYESFLEIEGILFQSSSIVAQELKDNEGKALELTKRLIHGYIDHII